jgi:hypothetical protein
MSSYDRSDEPLGKLKARQRNVDIEINDLMEQIKKKTDELKAAKERSAYLERTIKSRLHEVAVSDHAVIRYLERKEGFDAKAFRESILTPSFLKQVRKLGNGKYPIRDGMIAVVRQGVVVTIIGTEDEQE